MMFGKFLLLLGGSGALALVFLFGTAGSAVAIGVGGLSCACIASVFFGDFPAFARCPACGKRMKARRHAGPRRKGSQRYLSCSGCNQSVELGADSAARSKF